MMQKETSKRRRKQTAEQKTEHKPNWKEYTAMPEDIKAFLMDNIILRHNIITQRVEYRIPSSYETDGTDWQPITDRIVNSLWANNLCHDALAVLIACSNHLAWLIDSLPLKMSVAWHLLATEILTINHEFYLVAVAVCPQFYLLAFVSLQIPVCEDVQGWLVGPPRLKIPGLVFPEATVVENAELRVGGWILQWVRLSTIVETCPIEQS